MLRLADARQWLYPKAFRIPAPVWPADLAALVRDSEQALARVQAEAEARQEIAVPEPAAPAVSSESMTFLADVGTGLWRLRSRMLQPGTDRPLEEMRRAYRHLESTWDALSEAGLQIMDHTGMPFDTGLALKVITYQSTTGLTRERVVETLKPTIYFKDCRLQMGEVIVGTPQHGETATP